MTFQDYLNLLADSFNSETLGGLMCRDTISVDYKGTANGLNKFGFNCCVEKVQQLAFLTRVFL